MTFQKKYPRKLKVITIPKQKRTSVALYQAECLKRRTKTATIAEKDHEEQLCLPIHPEARINTI